MDFVQRTNAWWVRVRERYRLRWWFLLLLLLGSLIWDAFSGWIFARLTLDLAKDLVSLGEVIVRAPIGLFGLILVLYTAFILGAAYWETRPKRLLILQDAPHPDVEPDIAGLRAHFNQLTDGMRSVLVEIYREGPKSYSQYSDSVEALAGQGYIRAVMRVNDVMNVYELHPAVVPVMRDGLPHVREHGT